LTNLVIALSDAEMAVMFVDPTDSIDPDYAGKDEPHAVRWAAAPGV
jgi:hypothetical protein